MGSPRKRRRGPTTDVTQGCSRSGGPHRREPSSCEVVIFQIPPFAACAGIRSLLRKLLRCGRSAPGTAGMPVDQGREGLLPVIEGLSGWRVADPPHGRFRRLRRSACGALSSLARAGCLHPAPSPSRAPDDRWKALRSNHHRGPPLTVSLRAGCLTAAGQAWPAVDDAGPASARP
jgi:hypothetical protein